MKRISAPACRFLTLLTGLTLASVLTLAQYVPMTNNPNGGRDIQVASEYVTAITVTGDFDKARGLVSSAYIAHGPGGADSATIEKTVKLHQTFHQYQTNRKNEFSAQSFRIPSGNMKGDWVSLWGYYTYTDMRGGKAVTFPYQYTAKVTNGKIETDRLYYDELSILKQFGFKLIPPGVPAK
ncbi:nuclear transport factor 2 family protein [Fibrella aquatilis]|uniref:Nuclear transport factor 2 family protein n=1 Tax=Fibrella aquatilis TaxID=2817059 RepID=A0A939G6E9_9BACT|nr:nuclear transport factor 2 family protein [Fibrella aquatilis]MBO0933019.1 nuclear transport factor 2 family protein [Fibrella aquatilis]